MKINQSSFWFKTGAVIIPFFFSLIIFLFTAGTAQGQTINPGFESGTVPWVFYINTATGSFQSDAPGSGSPRAGHITILQPGSNVQLYQVNLALEPNTQYRLSFKAYSNTGHDLSVSLQKHGSPYSSYGLSSYVANLTTSWSDFSVQFTTSGFSGTVNDGRLMFWLAPYAAAGDQYFFDDITLEKAVISGSPAITLQPSSQTIYAGQTATFSVAATGALPLSYQWQKNGASIPGATGASYTTPATVLADNGLTFRSVITNSAGSTISNPATLTVASTPTPTSQLNLIANPGFESGTIPWVFYTNGAGGFSAASPGSAGSQAAKIAISVAGTNVQLYQAGITLKPGMRYRLSFDGYSNTGHDLSVSLQKHGSPYNNYGLNGYAANLTASWNSFSVDFTASGFSGTISDARLMFRLADTDAVGDNFWIDNVSLVSLESQTSDATAPSAPTSLSATPISSSQINLSWIASTDAVGVIGYKIYRGGTQIGTSATNSYSDSGLIASTTYAYTVSAYDAAGNESTQSTSVQAITNNINLAPALNAINNRNVDEGANLSFTLSAADPDNDPLIYSMAGLPTSAALIGSAFSWTPAYDQAGVYNLTFTVSDGLLADSETISVTVNDAPIIDIIPPSIPTNLATAPISSSQINLFWTVSTDDNVGAIGYEIYREGVQIAVSAANSYQNTGLAASTTYNYTVSAYDAAGNESDKSMPALTATPAQPNSNLVANSGFESGPDSWLFYATNGQAQFVAASPGFTGSKAAKISISQQVANNQLYQIGIALQSGVGYRLSFDAYSNTGHDLSVSLHKHGSPYTNYGISNYPVNLSPFWQRFSIEFNASGFSGIANDSRLRFWFADSSVAGDNFWIDNVSLEPFTLVCGNDTSNCINNSGPLQMLIFVSPQYANDDLLLNAISQYTIAVYGDIGWNTNIIKLNSQTNTVGQIRVAIKDNYQKSGIKAVILVGEDTAIALDAEYGGQKIPSVLPYAELNDDIEWAHRNSDDTLVEESGFFNGSTPSSVIDQIVAKGAWIPASVGFLHQPEVAVSLLYPPAGAGSGLSAYGEKRDKLVKAFTKFVQAKQRKYPDNIRIYDYNFSTPNNPNLDSHKAEIDGLSQLGSVIRDTDCAVNQNGGSCDFHLDEQYKAYALFGHGDPGSVFVSSKIAAVFSVSDLHQLQSPLVTIKGCYVTGGYVYDPARFTNQQYEPSESDIIFSNEIFSNPYLQAIIGGSEGSSNEPLDQLYVGLKTRVLADAYASLPFAVNGNAIIGDPTFHY